MSYTREIKKLSAYLEALKAENILECGNIPPQISETDVLDISFDSRKVACGCLFVCKGVGFKAEYLKKAIDAGAFAYVSEQDYEAGIPCIKVSDIRKAMAVLANCYNCNAWNSFPLIALTGTKGKSTSLYYIKNIIEKYTKKNGLKAFAYLSTIDTFDGKEFFESHLTTPESMELGLRFQHAAEADVFAMGMEVSSQALKYHRTYGVEFRYGAFLNFGVDHIGSTEHPTVEDYFRSKLIFMDQCKVLFVNLDSDRIEEIIEAAENSKSAEKIVYYSPSGRERVCGKMADYRAVSVRKEDGLTKFEMEELSGCGYDFMGTITLSMPGLFNVENALIAAIICEELNIPFEDIQNGLVDAKAAGRMEMFQMKEKDVKIVVDYAHNELSYERLFQSVKEEFPGYRVEILFGCPGGKGLDRRVALPRVTAKYADYAWITEEDPAFDDPMEISEEVLKNLESFGGKGEIIIDRTEAIKHAAEVAADKTILILAAKGREKYQHRGYDYIEIQSDAELAEELTK